ncbi:MAG TPA: hypothetical protein VFL79_03655 [Terriglobia bacterium]|nr:hypothetical protein [Terriglobia bacterium]
MRTLKAGVVYFAVVFGAGFVLGIPRVLWVAPKLGTRAAELIESPIMLVVVILAARWVARRFALPPTFAARLGPGIIALGLLLAAEFTVVLKVRRLTLAQYFAGRDPVAGAAYILLLIIFAAMPLAVGRSCATPTHQKV